MRHIRQHRDTDGMDRDDVREVAERAAEWLTVRGLTRPTEADIADALNAVDWWY